MRQNNVLIQRSGYNFRVSLPGHSDVELSSELFAELAKQIAQFQYEDDVETLARNVHPHAVTLRMYYDDYEFDGDQTTPYYSDIFWCEKPDDALNLIAQLKDVIAGIARTNDDLEQLEHLFAFDRPAYLMPNIDRAQSEQESKVDPNNPYNDAKLTVLALLLSRYSDFTHTDYWTRLKSDDPDWYDRIYRESHGLV